MASLGLVLPASGEVWLVDAPPDLGGALDRLADVRRPPESGVDRRPVDGIFLTHAHIGHYLGLAYLGFEALDARDLPVLASSRMAEFLRRNAPWSRLVDGRNIRLEEIGAGAPVALGDGVTVTPVAVPHRDELSDTFGYVIAASRKVLYVPDADDWESWKTPFAGLLDDVDVALLDGTFFSPDELPDRDVAAIGHPLVTTTMDRLQKRVDAGTLEVYFTHLNHSNPIVATDSPARRILESRGFHVAEDGDEIELGTGEGQPAQ